MKNNILSKKNVVFFVILTIICALCAGLIGVGLSAEAEGNTSVSVWDGTSDTSWFNADGNEFALTNAAQLAGFASLVNAGNTFEGKTVKLGVDIDLNGRAEGASEWVLSNADYTAEGYSENSVTVNSNKLWTPIGLYYGDEKKLCGTFDGQGHTISKMCVVSDKSGIGFVGGPYGGLGFTIQNVVFDDCFVMRRGDNNGNEDLAGIVVGYSDYYSSDRVPSLINVVVKNSTVRGDNTVGAVAGQINATNVINCKAIDNTVLGNATASATRVGGFFGVASDSNDYAKFEGNVLLGSTLTLPKTYTASGLWGGTNVNYTFTLNKCMSDSVEPISSNDCIDNFINIGYLVGLTSLTIDGEDKTFDFIVGNDNEKQYYTKINAPSVAIDFLVPVTVSEFKVNGVDDTHYALDSVNNRLTISGLTDQANNISIKIALSGAQQTLNLRIATGFTAMPELVRKVDGSAPEEAENYLSTNGGVRYFNEADSSEVNVFTIDFVAALDANAKAIIKYNGTEVTVTGTQTAALGNLSGGGEQLHRRLLLYGYPRFVRGV